MPDHVHSTRSTDVPRDPATLARMAATLADPLTPDVLRRAATSECTILITGETGVGKGHLAAWIHAASDRADGPLVPVNCGAIPETLVDSQLFGHTRGAFSGATADHIGLIRAAEGGTLLLDEVSELPLSAQTRLLRLLQDREVQPVGRPRPVVVDVRVIAATNVDLHDAVETRRFREDLLFRLDVVRLPVRPLRERPDEIPGLVDRFNDEFAALYRRGPLEFTAAARAALTRFGWPGNVRQLRTVIERLHVLCADRLVTPELLADLGQLRSEVEPGPDLDRLKRDAVQRVLDEAGGSVARAALTLGVHRSTLYRWLRQHPGA